MTVPVTVPVPVQVPIQVQVSIAGQVTVTVPGQVPGQVSLTVPVPEGAIKYWFDAEQNWEIGMARCEFISQEAPRQDDPECGRKNDAGKIRPGLVLGDFANALTEVTKVGTFGSEKYSDHGWLSVPDGPARYEDAMFRHWLAIGRGEKIDPESGLSHWGHFAWNALAVLELIETYHPDDD